MQVQLLLGDILLVNFCSLDVFVDISAEDHAVAVDSISLILILAVRLHHVVLCHAGQETDFVPWLIVYIFEHRLLVCFLRPLETKSLSLLL